MTSARRRPSGENGGLIDVIDDPRIPQQAVEFCAYADEQPTVRGHPVKIKPVFARSAPDEALLTGLPVISPDLAFARVVVAVGVAGALDIAVRDEVDQLAIARANRLGVVTRGVRELPEIQGSCIRHPDLRKRPAVFGIVSPAQDHLGIQATRSE